ncbi:MAG TPA: amidohydrolase [Vicinamibacterales bacterium]|nr:amidohydrolase [Vicinamibacterales bacterium]
MFRVLRLMALVALAVGSGQDARQVALQGIDARADHYASVARQIWDLAEVGYQEEQSSKLLQAELQAAGFRVEAGVAGMPTAFVANFGSGEPVIGILAEFDALPGITQTDAPERTPVDHMAAGHACGHHLFGTGSVATAIAVKGWLQATGRPGTIRLYGTPAEEGGAGKVYMVREGLFKDVDIVLHWHASDRNDASPGSSLANKSAKFRFRGVSAHAAAAPERGRSALDGVEAMNHMVNMMREHVPEDTRIHYVITHGGSAPNVIPDFAEVFYYVRHPDPVEVQALFDRVVKASEGAAMGTGTTVDHEVIHGIYAMLPNDVLARVMDRNLRQVGGVSYTAGERAFAERLRQSLPDDAPPIEAAAAIATFEMKEAGGSTDVADVSWVVPTTGLRTATWVPGTASHSWQAIAAGGTSIGTKGMIVAAKTLTSTAIDLFLKPQTITEARAEYRTRVGPAFQYVPLVGNRPPPLDYRKR